METYENIDDYLSTVFPLEVKKMPLQKKLRMQEELEEADAEFVQKLAEIIQGETGER